MLKRIDIKNRVISTVIFTVLMLFFSCNIIYDDLDPCPRGVNLRFVFDYNMEYANVFPSKVDCYTLLIYDKQGNFLKSFSEEGDKLKDENYRLKIDLPHGSYHFVVYGGITCRNRSFSFVHDPVNGMLSDLRVRMNYRNGMSDQLLHDFYHGAMDVTVDGEMYQDMTIYMMRNTNHIRVLLQHLNGSSIPLDQFKILIEDDNTLFDAANNLISDGMILYTPWTMGKVRNDAAADDNTSPIGFAEFSTSRFSVNVNNRLIVRRADNDEEVLNIPLNKYLLLLKSERFGQMDAQEFLDRENDWSIVFFLDSKNIWINSRIIVNGWTVRLNGTDL